VVADEADRYSADPGPLPVASGDRRLHLVGANRVPANGRLGNRVGFVDLMSDDPESGGQSVQQP
jgi:hypothetical protein